MTKITVHCKITTCDF